LEDESSFFSEIFISKIYKYKAKSTKVSKNDLSFRNSDQVIYKNKPLLNLEDNFLAGFLEKKGNLQL